MEKDIEILEKYIETICEPTPIHKVIPDWATIEKEQIQAIENLIQENKELSVNIKKKDKQIEQYINMLATNDMLHVLECEQKDKIIDLMARAWKQDDERSVEEIIQYFTQKAEGSK